MEPELLLLISIVILYIFFFINLLVFACRSGPLGKYLASKRKGVGGGEIAGNLPQITGFPDLLLSVSFL